MLTLSRTVGQSVMIGNDVEVCVVAVRGGAVKLSIKAPRDITILRDELRHEVQPPNRTASALTHPDATR